MEPPTCRILSIDGGGIRGILPARVLREIEERTGKSIAETFNFIAGTSTGGLLALGLGTPRPGGSTPYSAKEMLDFYQTKGPKIFSNSLWHSFTSLGSITDARYDANNIDGVLKDLLADRRLSDCFDDIDLLIPAYEIERREAYFFKSCHAKGDPVDTNISDNALAKRNFLARDVARSTSAAPTYFEPAHVQNLAGETFSFIDGGVFANNPTVCAVVAARWLYPSAKRFCILSLGTGTTERPIRYAEAKDWGLLGWARPIISVMMGGNSETVDYEMEEIKKAFAIDVNYHRFEIDLDRHADPSIVVNDDFDDASPANISALFDTAELLLSKFKQPLDDLIAGFNAQPKTPRPILRAPTPTETPAGATAIA